MWIGAGRSGWFGFGVGRFLFPSFKQKVFQGFLGNALRPVGSPLPGIPGRGVSLVCVCVGVRVGVSVRACARIGYITI